MLYEVYGKQLYKRVKGRLVHWTSYPNEGSADAACKRLNAQAGYGANSDNTYLTSG